MRVREDMTPEQERQLELVTAASYALAVLRDPQASASMRRAVSDRLDTALQMYYKGRAHVPSPDNQRT